MSSAGWCGWSDGGVVCPRPLIGTGERPFRLLSLSRVADLVQPGEAPGAPISAEATLRDALADCLWTGRDRLPVQGGGMVTLIGT